MKHQKTLLGSAICLALSSTPALAATDQEVSDIRAELAELRAAYENRISELENRLVAAEQTKTAPVAANLNPVDSPASATRAIRDNRFNPSIGVVLNGQYKSFSSDEGEIAGFAVGEEGERHGEGFSVDHTELNFSASIDDKFLGSVTAAIAEHEGETEVELEEAYIQTLPGAGLPSGLGVKAGRALWTFGYLNEHHAHADDFADRPLPYRVFMDEAYNDDGAQVSYVLPTPIYSEVGAGVFRGDDHPFGESGDSSPGAFSVYGRVGNDIGSNQSWRVGAYALSGSADGGRLTNEGEVEYLGDTNLYAVDARYTYAPTGNARDKELTLQAEYFLREEDGTYEDFDAGTGPIDLDDNSSGWYAQAVYKFLPQWRVGARYSELNAASVPLGLVGSALDSEGHDPKAYSAMVDWTNSEFSRIRLQFNREEVAAGQDDNQVLLQYVMSLGAHGAHAY